MSEAVYNEFVKDFQNSNPSKPEVGGKKRKARPRPSDELKYEAEKNANKRKKAAKKARVPKPSKAPKGRSQQVRDFLYGECPPTTEVDLPFVESLTYDELDLDNEHDYDPDEVTLPLHRYPLKAQEKFWTDVDGYSLEADAYQEKFNRELLGKNNEPGLKDPIFLPTGHVHLEPRLTEFCASKLFQILSTQKSPGPVFMSDNENYHLMRQRKYETFENYIAPLIATSKYNGSSDVMTGTIRELDNSIGSQMGTKCDGVEYFSRSKLQSVKQGDGVFVACYNASSNSLFFLAVVFALDRDLSANVGTKHFYRTKYVTPADTHSEVILDASVHYVTHFYFVCECRSKATKV